MEGEERERERERERKLVCHAAVVARRHPGLFFAVASGEPATTRAA
jgi:hypothetical protein